MGRETVKRIDALSEGQSIDRLLDLVEFPALLSAPCPNGPTTSSHSTAMADVWDAYREELEGVEEQIRKNLDSSVAPRQYGRRAHSQQRRKTCPTAFLSSLRPSLRLYRSRPSALGSLVEFIHTATLLHDDVVDEADLRRGRRTASKIWGNQISILVGDYLYSKAICQIVDFRNQGINEVLVGSLPEDGRRRSPAALLQRQSLDAGAGISPHRRT